MTTQSNQQGSIFILPQAIKTVARNAALQSYGVISLAPANREKAEAAIADLLNGQA